MKVVLKKQKKGFKAEKLENNKYRLTYKSHDGKIQKLEFVNYMEMDNFIWNQASNNDIYKEINETFVEFFEPDHKKYF